MKTLSFVSFCSLILTLFSCPVAFSLDDETQLWTQFYWQGPMNHSLRAYIELQDRYSFSDYKKTETVMVRPAMLYSVLPTLSVGAGYLWAPILAPRFTDENRYWQQMVVTHQFEIFTAIARLRLEQRDVKGTPHIAHRARLQLRAQYDYFQDGQWWLVAWDEYFYNFNDSGSSIKKGFNQNRFFIGINHKIHDQIRLEFGPMSIYVNRIGKEDRLINGAILAAFTSF